MNKVYKKLVACAMAGTMMLSSAGMAFANTSATDKLDKLVELDVLHGDNGTGLEPSAEMERYRAFVMLLRLTGHEDEMLAYNYQGKDTFSDAADYANNTYQSKLFAYLKNHPEFGIAGYDDGSVNPYGEITQKEYAKVILETLGYKDDVDFTWDTLEEVAVQLGLIENENEASNDVIQISGVANLTYDALTKKAKDSDNTLGHELGYAIAPVITITDVDEEDGYLEGTVNRTDVTVTVDGDEVDVDENGEFSAVVDLEVGRNHIEIVATDEDGNSTTETVTMEKEEFEVNKIITNNLKTMRINLNSKVDEDTVTTSTVEVELDGSSVVDSVDVTDDLKTIVVSYTAVDQSDELELTIDGVEDVDGQEITDYDKEVTVTDRDIPEAIGAYTLNQKQIEIRFNEPIDFTKASYQVLNNVKIDGVSIIAKATPDNVKNTIVLDFPSVLDDGSHTLEISDLIDYAGFKALPSEHSFSVTEDSSAPMIIDAKAKNMSQIEVTFDEKVAVNGTIEVNGTEATATPVDGSNNTKFLLTGFGGLDLGAIVEVKITYVDQEDVSGNTVEDEIDYKFAVEDDTSLPTVSTKIGDDNKVTFTFSKSMDANEGTITIKDSDDDILRTINAPFTFEDDTNNTVLEISAAAAGLNNLDPEEITIKLEDFEDGSIRSNLLPDKTITVNANDTKNPTVDTHFFAKDGSDSDEDTVTFYFSEPMNTATLNNLSNYVGSSLGSLSSVDDAEVKSISDNGKTVTITVPDFRSVKDTEEFTIYALKDTQGNMLATATGVNILAATALEASSAESEDVREIKVVFDTRIDAASIDPSALKVQMGGSDEAVFVNAELDADDTTGKTVIFTTNKDLETDMSLYTIVDHNGDLIKNVYGTGLGATALSITDKVAPTIELESDVAGELKFTFSEAVNATNEATLLQDLIVRDEDDDIVNLAGNITYKKDGAASDATDFDELIISGFESDDNYSVEFIARNVTDLASTPNVIEALERTTIEVK